MPKLKYSELIEWLAFKNEFLEEQMALGPLECYYCGRGSLDVRAPIQIPGAPKERRNNLLTLDHKVPLSQGGGRLDKTNVVVSCFKCNHKKGPLTIEQWLAEKGTKYLCGKQRQQKTQGKVVGVV